MTKKQPKEKIRVLIIESERGWGRKVDSVKEFTSRKQAEAFVEKYNKPNVDNWNKTHEVPDWYMQAEIEGE